LAFRISRSTARDRSPAYVLDVVEIQLRGAFDGNLLNLAHSGVPRSALDAAGESAETPVQVPVPIENGDLEGFIDPFR
jgi:hypothetical protein